MTGTATTRIAIDLGKKCAECGHGGVAPNGLCLSCVTRAMKPGASMRTPQGRAVQQYWRALRQGDKR